MLLSIIIYIILGETKLPFSSSIEYKNIVTLYRLLTCSSLPRYVQIKWICIPCLLDMDGYIHTDITIYIVYHECKDFVSVRYYILYMFMYIYI